MKTTARIPLHTYQVFVLIGVSEAHPGREKTLGYRVIATSKEEAERIGMDLANAAGHERVLMAAADLLAVSLGGVHRPAG
jgi:hypothetical protein